MSDTQPMCGKYRSYAKYSKASIFAPHTKSITGSSFWCFGSEEHGMTKKTEEKIWGHFSASKVKRRIKVMNWATQIFKMSTNKTISPSRTLNRLIRSFKKVVMVSRVSKTGQNYKALRGVDIMHF